MTENAFNADAEATATEAVMTEKTIETKTETTKVEGRPKRVAKHAATKTARPKKEKATAKAKPKREKPPKEDLVVFACRVAETERDAFHKATGPAGASRFARLLMAVFSNEDEAGFRALLKEARELRK